MYVNPKRITKLGRDRFGSAIFIDDVNEEVVDIFVGTRRNSQLLLILLILSVSKILSVNYLGILITLPTYYLLFFFSTQRIRISVTNHRILVTTGYNYPRIVKAFAYTLIISAMVIFSRLVFASILDPYVLRTALIRTFSSNNLLITRLLYNYRLLFTTYTFEIVTIDSIITIITNLYFGYIFTRIRLQFKEVNLSQISEQLTTLGKDRSVVDMSIMVLLSIIVLALFPFVYSVMVILSLTIIYRYMYRKRVTVLSLFGQTSRPLVSKVQIENTEYNSLVRLTSAIFGWQTPLTENNRGISLEGLIPLGIVSEFDTGNQAWLKPALIRGNIIGGIVATLINATVIISLYQFAKNYVPSAISTVINIMLILIGFSLVFGIAIYIVTEVYVRIQTTEKLMIGQNFVARYIHPSLWIVKGSKIEGTKVRRGIRSNMIRYDKARGIAIDYERLTLLSILATVVLAIGWWSTLGGIYLPILPQVVISSLDLIFEFFIQKAQAGFFIIFSFIVWLGIYIIYPRIQSSIQPSLNLDLEYASVTPIVLKDFGDHMDASVQFAKAMINSSRPQRRLTNGRPGTILVDISLIEGSIGVGEKIEFIAGNNKRTHEIDIPIMYPTRLFKNLITSGLKGYPIVELEIKISKQDKILLHEDVLISVMYAQYTKSEVDLGSFGHVELEITIASKRS